MTDFSELNRVINESGYKRRFIAQKLGFSYQTFLNKMNGLSDFTAEEMNAIKDMFKLSDRRVIDIFFAEKSGNMPHNTV